MKISQGEMFILNLAKELTIAKLSQSAPTRTTAETGIEIGEMFKAIYSSVSEVIDHEE